MVGMSNFRPWGNTYMPTSLPRVRLSESINLPLVATLPSTLGLKTDRSTKRRLTIVIAKAFLSLCIKLFFGNLQDKNKVPSYQKHGALWMLSLAALTCLRVRVSIPCRHVLENVRKQFKIIFTEMSFYSTYP